MMQVQRARRDHRDMTRGNPVSLILGFSVPLMFGNLFQQLYSIADAVVIGKFVGVDAFAAVGCASWVCWLINAFCRDSANAFSVVASVSVGRGDQKTLRRIIANAAIYGTAASVLMTGALLMGLPLIIRALSIPQNICVDAHRYLLVYVLSIPLALFFNLMTAILRATGDSNVTFRAMTASTIANIVLDLLFVFVFRWGVLGAAAATWISTGVSMLIALKACARQSIFHLEREEFLPDPAILADVFRLFAPMFFNSLIISVGGLYVQKYVNAQGSVFSAGRSAEGKIFCILEAIIMAVQTGVSVFVGQNLGAQKIVRIRDGLIRITIVTFGMIIVMGTVAMALRRPMLNLFLSVEDPVSYEEAFRVAYDSCACVLLGMLIMTPMYIHRVTIQALGHAECSAFAGACQMIIRILTIRLGPALIGVYAYYITDCMAWVVSLPIVSIPCYIYLSRMIAQQEGREAGK